MPRGNVRNPDARPQAQGGATTQRRDPWSGNQKQQEASYQRGPLVPSRAARRARPRMTAGVRDSDTSPGGPSPDRSLSSLSGRGFAYLAEVFTIRTGVAPPSCAPIPRFVS